MNHTLEDVIKSEKKYLEKRRTHLNADKATEKINDDLIGIASSGGGVRSAAVNLGFLKILTKYGILQKADYHSTVSGGGYAGAFIQGTVREEGRFDGLFDKDKEEHLRKVASNYMAPNGAIDHCRMYLAFIVYFLMSAAKWMIVLGIFYCIAQIIGLLIRYPLSLMGYESIWMSTNLELSVYFGLVLFLGVMLQYLSIFAVRYLSTIVLNLMLWSILIWGLWLFIVMSYKGQLLFPIQIWNYLGILIMLIFISKALRLELLSFGIYYEKKIAEAFLKFAPYSQSLTIPLADLEAGKEARKVNFFQKLARNAEHPFSKTPESLTDHYHFLTPYPLINCCLNLSGSSTGKNNENISSDDYFLISPKFIGSEATTYLKADTEDYRSISLPAAIRISAAAVNAGMGSFSSPLRSFFITIFNASLGQWVRNPNVSELKFIWSFGPGWFLRDLVSKRGMNSGLVNISDGGHIENLGVFELLRRKCKLIICIDAGYDPHYSFEDLENLTKRSFSELGMEIRFREGQDPMQVIKPGLKGFSEGSFAVADVYEWWNYSDPEANCNSEEPISTIIYIKSSLTKEYILSKENQSKVSIWKKHKFPHTPTSDQFLEPELWDSYYKLGQFLAKNMLQKMNVDSEKSRMELIELFKNNSKSKK